MKIKCDCGLKTCDLGLDVCDIGGKIKIRVVDKEKVIFASFIAPKWLSKAIIRACQKQGYVVQKNKPTPIG